MKKTNQTIIFRVERLRGIGPYNRRYYNKWQNENWSVNNNPFLSFSFESKDVQKVLKYNWLCGFKTKKDLTNWFSPSQLKKLYKLGFKVVIIEPEKLVVGYKQVIFKGRKSTKRLNLSEVL